jgi:cation-transporting ATPase E
VFLIALLPNQRRYEKGFLKRSLRFCIPAGLITGLAVIALAIVIRSDQSWSQPQAQTATAILLSVTGVWVLLSLARPLNRTKLAIVGFMVVLAIGMFTLPLTTEFFGFAYLDNGQLWVALGIGAVACLFIAVAARFAGLQSPRTR